MNLICTVRSGQSNIKQVLKENLSISERLFKKVKHGHIFVNGTSYLSYKPLKPNDLVTVDLDFDEECENIVPNENIHFKILYEDEWLIIVNKPCNMPVHPSLNYYETSLSNTTESSAGTGVTAQSKQGVIPTSGENSATSSWYGLYSKQKEYTGKNGSVESSMIWGSQYDRILNWVKEGKNDEEKTKIISQKLGNHGGSITTTLVVASHFILSRTELCENQNQNNRRFRKNS